ncbi:MAG TPA: Ldh family oxidoreductase [Anaerolineaceae bacterium]|nr:Ldh family oxidoreductase [Anaerolineaceae bacterium]
MAKASIYNAQDLYDFMVQFFVKLGVPYDRAEITAEILQSADLRGVSSHGIIRLQTYYGSRLQKGLINPLANNEVLRESPSSLAIDGKNGLGQVAGKDAMLRCIEKAKNSGVAMVTVRNSNHYGIAGYYAMMALDQDMIGISFTNAQPLVAPTFGSKRLLGTNPIAVAAPAFSEKPFVLDMATSIVPIGKVTVFDKAGEELPEGWAVDSNGNPTTNPKQVLNGGALFPLGGPEILRGYKGYGLALWVDIFSGVLSGAAFGREVADPSKVANANVGHFFAAIRLDAFRDPDEFKKDLDTLFQQLKTAEKAEGQDRIFIHGEKEFELTERFQKEGIPLLDEVVRSLINAGDEIGVPFDLIPIGEKEIDPAHAGN